MITLNKGGSKEKTVPIESIHIPDLWHIAHIRELEGYSVGGVSVKDLILECWHLAHDLKNHIEQE